MKKKTLYYIIAGCLPLVFLLLLELSLALVGFGRSQALFIDSKAFTGYAQPNPNVIERFFHVPTQAPDVAPDTYYFKRQKPAKTLRFVLMGGSSAAGFPYGRFGSPAGMLHHQLKILYPSHDIEIISVAMSGVNSYALRDFTAEVIDIAPDAVLIYAGHNEYLGIMGVGSAFAGSNSHFANLVFLHTKDWRIMQMVQSFVHTFNAPANTQAEDTSRTLMARVAQEKNIPLNSELYIAGREQFRNNMEYIARQFETANIPLMLSTIASNEKHQAPFSSNDDDPLLSANIAYRQAQNLSKQGNKAQALSAFQRARDLDLLRFRAPSEFNQILRNIARRSELINLVDAEQIIRNDTEDGIIGNQHMLEHLHPNARGYFLIAEAFLQTLQTHNILPLPDLTISIEQRWDWQALSNIEQASADFKIKRLKADYPFTKTPMVVKPPQVNDDLSRLINRRIRGDSWIEVNQDAFAYWQRAGQILNAAHTAGLLADALPEQSKAARQASLLYLKAQVLPLAWYYARQASELSPQEHNYRLTYAEILYRLGNQDSAIELLHQVLQEDPSHRKARQILKYIQQNSQR